MAGGEVQGLNYTQYDVLPWRLKPGGPWIAGPQGPVHSLLCREGHLAQQASSQEDQVQCLLVPESWISVPYQPVELFKQVNHILLREWGALHPLDTTKPQSLSCTVPGCSLCSQVQPPRGPVWPAASSSHWLCVYVTKELLSTSSDQCRVSCVWPSP